MFKQDEIEEALLKSRQEMSKKMAEKIATTLEADRSAAYTAAERGRIYAYPKHFLLNETGISMAMIIPEVEKLMGRESDYLQIKQEILYSRKGVLSHKRTWGSQKVLAVVFRLNRRGTK